MIEQSLDEMRQHAERAAKVMQRAAGDAAPLIEFRLRLLKAVEGRRRLSSDMPAASWK